MTLTLFFNLWYLIEEKLIEKSLLVVKISFLDKKILFFFAAKINFFLRQKEKDKPYFFAPKLVYYA